MTIEQELALSYYQQVADIDKAHRVFLVQDVRSGKFFVKKELTVYNAEIYHYLQAHPIANVPQIHLIVEDAGILTVVEDHIDGDTLADKLARQGTLCAQEATDIAVQLCRILKDFHQCSPAIVNRDIKPENIKITPDGIVKLVDLNAAKRSDPGKSKDTRLLGTQGYAAPEQYGFGSSSILTDIYAVGVLINVVCTGVLPDERTVDGHLGKIVRKCVELSPKQRFASMDKLLAALEGKVNTNADPRRFYPPGFRAKDILQWLMASILYAVLLKACLDTGAKFAGSMNKTGSQISLIVTILAIILFSGNYLNIQQSFILTRSKNRLVRWLGIFLVDTAMLFLWTRFIALFGA